MDLGQERIVPASYPLIGYIGEQVQLIGSIKLPVTTGSYPKQATVMVCFLLVDRPLAYNAIIGRITLNELGVITSNPHLKMKFPTDHRVGEVEVN